jgi:hypothetical protein
MGQVLVNAGAGQLDPPKSTSPITRHYQANEKSRVMTGVYFYYALKPLPLRLSLGRRFHALCRDLSCLFPSSATFRQ